MDNEGDISKYVRSHHASGSTRIDEWHNKSHDNIDSRLKAFKKNGGNFAEARTIAEDAASQLKVSANLLEADGDEHLVSITEQLNEDLPENERFYIPPKTNKKQT